MNPLHLCFRSVVGGEVPVTSVPRGAHISPCPSAIPAGGTWLVAHTWSPLHPLRMVRSTCSTWFCRVVFGQVGLSCFCCCFCLILAKFAYLGNWHTQPCGKGKVKESLLVFEGGNSKLLSS